MPTEIAGRLHKRLNRRTFGGMHDNGGGRCGMMSGRTYLKKAESIEVHTEEVDHSKLDSLLGSAEECA